MGFGLFEAVADAETEVKILLAAMLLIVSMPQVVLIGSLWIGLVSNK